MEDVVLASLSKMWVRTFYENTTGHKNSELSGVLQNMHHEELEPVTKVTIFGKYADYAVKVEKKPKKNGILATTDNPVSVRSCFAGEK